MIYGDNVGCKMKMLLGAMTLCLSLSEMVGKSPSLTFGSSKLLHQVWPNTTLTSSFGKVLLPVKTDPDATIPECSGVSALPALDDAGFGTVRSVDIASKDKYVAITFDYCELCTNINGYQPEVIQYLRKHNIPATLFMSGKWMQSHSDIAEQLIGDPLFEIGNHTWSHANLALTPTDVLDQQVMATQAEYVNLRQHLALKADMLRLSDEMRFIPVLMTLIRLPYGRCNDVALKRLQHHGLNVIQWSHVGLEGHEASDQQFKKFMNSLTNGSIILLHGNHVPKYTLPFLKRLVPILQSKGYTCVTVSDLLQKGTPNREKEGYFFKPGDNLSLDTQFGIMGTGLKK